MKASTMATRALLLLFNFLIIMELVGHLMVVEVYGDDQKSFAAQFAQNKFHLHNHIVRKMQTFKASLARLDADKSIAAPPTALISPPPRLSPSPQGEEQGSREYHVTSYGADPTGKEDSTEALLKVFSEVTKCRSNGHLMDGISNLGGVEIHLDGGDYLISRPLQFPRVGLGNILIHGGSIRASDNFPTDRYLIELSASTLSNQKHKTTTTSFNQMLSSSLSQYNFEYITFRDLMFDCNFRGGGIAIINSLRISIDNCYIAHFTTDGIRVQSGHETLIRSSFLGQHITAGNDPGEQNFSGTGITLMGNDNVVSDVVIFSADTGIMISGQANLISGVHCYNKAIGFGGKGIYLKLPSLAQTRIVNSYLDYTSIVVEDPVQLIISNNFFLGDAFISLKAIKGVASGVNIVDNIFSGSGKGVDIIQLDGIFGNVDQVFVDRNSVSGMNFKATVAKTAVEGNGSSWTADFSGVLLFPDLIKHVQYTLSTIGEAFPTYALRNMSNNQVVIQSNMAAPTSVYVMVDQGYGH